MSRSGLRRLMTTKQMEIYTSYLAKYQQVSALALSVINTTYSKISQSTIICILFVFLFSLFSNIYIVFISISVNQYLSALSYPQTELSVVCIYDFTYIKLLQAVLFQLLYILLPYNQAPKFLLLNNPC